MLGGGRDGYFKILRNNITQELAWEGAWEADNEYFYGSARFSTGSCGKQTD